MGRDRRLPAPACCERSIEQRLAFLKFAAGAAHLGAASARAWRRCGRRSPHAHASATVKMPHAGADAPAARGGAAPGAASAPAHFRPKLRYAHQGGMNPPMVVIHGNSLEHVHRRLQALPRRAASASTSSCVGTPLRIEMQTRRGTPSTTAARRAIAAASRHRGRARVITCGTLARLQHGAIS
ncbi:MAG: hypothetical protein MZW92_41815 [Comamonadaceae bacterium]|nr:hypothetical protein [Comamonadaceae bacterium]